MRRAISKLGVFVSSAFAAGGAVRGEAGAPLCSQWHRAVSGWQGKRDCGPDLTGLLELTPIGNHQLMARRRFASVYDVWSVSQTGAVAAAPAPVPDPEGGLTAGFAFLPGSAPR